MPNFAERVLVISALTDRLPANKMNDYVECTRKRVTAI
jgi:hypothetical protein